MLENFPVRSSVCGGPSELFYLGLPAKADPRYKKIAPAGRTYLITAATHTHTPEISSSLDKTH